MPTVRVLQYVAELDAFVITDEYRRVADQLGLTEWHPAVWICRLLVLDNDFGEHLFDNWDEREQRKEQASLLGINSGDLMIVVPERLANGEDGPCNPPNLRKAFWTNVLKSLELDYELIFAKARQTNERMREVLPDEYIADLEARIAEITAVVGA